MSKARSSNKVVDLVIGELLAKLAVVDSKQTNKICKTCKTVV